MAVLYSHLMVNRTFYVQASPTWNVVSVPESVEFTRKVVEVASFFWLSTYRYFVMNLKFVFVRFCIYSK
jgi:hypothetical protein